jgi:hypothetical protein
MTLLGARFEIYIICKLAYSRAFSINLLHALQLFAGSPLGIGVTFQAHAVKAPVALIAYKWGERKRKRKRKRKRSLSNLSRR